MNKDEYITIDTSVAEDITFDVSDITLSGIDTITIDTARKSSCYSKLRAANGQGPPAYA